MRSTWVRQQRRRTPGDGTVDAVDVVGAFAMDPHALDSATEHAVTDGDGQSGMR
jgi:hypothetical protein